MNVGEMCRRDVVTARPDASIRHVAELMRNKHVGSVVIVEGSAARARPIGIVTDRDLVVEIMAQDVDEETVTIGDVMTDELVMIEEGQSVTDAVKLMRANGVRRIVVTDAHDRLAGILSIDDFLGLLVDELYDVIRLFVREQMHERASRSVA